MIYLNLNQSCVNYTGIDVPNDVMRIIYDYLITHKYKSKLINILSIIKDDFIYYEELQNKKGKDLMQMNHKIKTKNGSGKNGNIKKQDCIDALYLWHIRSESLNKVHKLNAEWVYNKFYYNKNTKKYITSKEYFNMKDIINDEIDDYLKNICNQMKILIKNNINNIYDFKKLNFDSLNINTYGFIDRLEKIDMVNKRLEHIKIINKNTLSYIIPLSIKLWKSNGNPFEKWISIKSS